MTWLEDLLIDLPNPNTSGWLADIDADWWAQLRAYYATVGPFDTTFDSTFE